MAPTRLDENQPIETKAFKKFKGNRKAVLNYL
jgi:hypothetical protein